VVLTLVLRSTNTPAGVDHTDPDDYYANTGEEGVREELPMPGEDSDGAATTPGEDTGTGASTRR